MVRYWNGTAWTEHRQPMPTSVPTGPASVTVDPAPVPVVPAVAQEVVQPVAAATVSEPTFSEQLVSEPTSELSATELAMIEFERQFEKQAAEEFAHANAQASPALSDTASTPKAPAVETPFSAPSRFAPVPVESVADMWSMVSDQDAAPQRETAPASLASSFPPAAVPASSPASAIATAPPPQLLDPAPDSAGDPALSRSIAPRKKRTSGGARGMIIGAIVIVLGLGIFGYLTYQAMPEPGEGIADAVVTDLGASSSSNGGQTCAPVARFAVAGKSYTASTSTAVTSCPVSLGQSVKVIYDVKAPSTSGRIQVAGPFANLVGLIPLTGLIVFIASLIVFMRSRSKAAPIS